MVDLATKLREVQVQHQENMEGQARLELGPPRRLCGGSAASELGLEE